MGPNTVFIISVNVIWGSTHSPGDESSQGGVGTFPNYLNRYVPPNRVVILERFRLLRNSVCRVASRLGKNLKIAGLISDSMRGVGTKMCFFVDLSQLQDFMLTLVKNAHVFFKTAFY